MWCEIVKTDRLGCSSINICINTEQQGMSYSCLRGYKRELNNWDLTHKLGGSSGHDKHPIRNDLM